MPRSRGPAAAAVLNALNSGGNKAVFRVVATALIFTSLALGQDNAGGISGRIEANLIVDARAAIETGDVDFQSAELRFQAELGVRLWKGADLKTVTRFRADAFDRLEAGVPSQAAISPLSRRAIIGDRSDLELREFYLKTDFGRGHISLGKQQIVWGQADGLKVLDVVNPQDFREFILEDFGDSRIPLWSVNAEIPVRNVTAQFIWLPDQSHHKLPEPGSAYSFTAPGFAIIAPPGVDLIVRDAERPKSRLANSDIGTRVSTLAGGWDLTANYFYHYEDLPAPFSEVTFSRTAPVPEGPTLTVTPRYQRTHLAGGTFSNAFGSMVLRGEAAYFFNRPLISREIVDGKSFLVRDQFRHVVGLDWFRFSETLISVQLFQDWVPQHVPALFVDRVATSFSVLLRRDFLNQTLTPEVLMVQNATCGSGMLRPRVSYALNDHTKLRLGADLFHGNQECDFGQFAQRDRIVMGVTWAF